MINSQNRFVKNIPTYNAKARYSVNKVVTDGADFYQNITGGNGTPSSLVDWIKLPSLTGGGSGGFNKILQWDGTSTITVPAGYSGSLFNMTRNKWGTYSVVGTTLTINGSTAETDDMLQFTSN